jgi:serine protease Do
VLASTAPTANGLILVEIQEASARRTIVDKQEITSQYKSGTRNVSNPQYTSAQVKCQRAQADLTAQQTRNSINPGRGWGAVLQGLAEGLSAASVTKICEEFAATPPSVEQDVYSSYAYTVSEIELLRQVRGRALAIDQAGNLETFPLAVEERTRSKVAYGVKDGDRGGSQYMTDDQFETVAAQAFDVDPEAIVMKLDLSQRTVHPASQVQRVLAEMPQSRTRPPQSPAVATGSNEVIGSTQRISISTRRSGAIDPTSVDERMGSVVIVLNPKGSMGAGFYVDSNAILTNFHVVEGANTIELRGLDGEIFTGRVIRRDIGVDLALVQVERQGAPVQFANSIVRAGDSVEAIGHPKGFYYSISKGIVSAVRRMKGALAPGADSALVIQTDAAINPGNSGGPLFVKDRVVGLNTIKFKGADGVGFAVHYSEIVKFLSQ